MWRFITQCITQLTRPAGSTWPVRLRQADRLALVVATMKSSLGQGQGQTLVQTYWDTD